MVLGSFLGPLPLLPPPGKYVLYVCMVRTYASHRVTTNPTNNIYVPQEKLTDTHAFPPPLLLVLLLLLPKSPRRCAGRERMADPRVHWPARPSPQYVSCSQQHS